LTFDWSNYEFLSYLENLIALNHISEDHTLLRKSSHTHTHTHTHAYHELSILSNFFFLYRKIYVHWLLDSHLHVCVFLTCYLIEFSSLYTCVCCFLDEELTLLSSFVFVLWKFFTVCFHVFGLWNCLVMFTLCPFETKMGSIFIFGPGLYF
jgi:hypothetical protein